MRGKVPNRRSTETKPGITPAYAGKSTCLILFDTLLKDHPRVCGEKKSIFAQFWAKWGSPPRMRGKAHDIEVLKDALRITPAYAGKSWHSYGPKNCRRDHPRVCGEKTVRTVATLDRMGSPPRMRGKGVVVQILHSLYGITPAYAGKRDSGRLSAGRGRDHPRVCGEKSLCCMRWPTRRGSPPRMRGKAGPNSAHNMASGITPAYAGKSHRIFRCGHADKDHPRVCGEKQTPRSTGSAKPGSPPRMRGKVAQHPGEGFPMGITPAYAGKRLCLDLRHPAIRDHPRVCGEKQATAAKAGLV